MNTRKIKLRKPLKLLILLLTSLLIATASAASYKYMFIDGSVTIGVAKVLWIEGSEFGSGSISGSTATVALSMQEGTPENFTECLFLWNNDTVAHNMTISVTTTLQAADFDECKMHICENSTTPGTWTYVDTLDITTTDSYETYTANTPLVNGGFYRMTFEFDPTVGASGTKPFDIKVEYE